jgi:aminopeptidase N
LQADWNWAFDTHQVQAGYSPNAQQAGQRALAGLALNMLCLAAAQTGDTQWPGRAYQRVKDAHNMTERMAAMVALLDSHSPLVEPALKHFHNAAQGDALVLDKWFSLQATAPEPVAGLAPAVAGTPGSAFARAKALFHHPDFSIQNPNRARSLMYALFNSNPAAFHRSDAAGYVLWADKLLELDALNPHVAGRMARSLDRWAALAEPYRSAARMAIARVAAKPDLSSDVREVVNRALENA